MNKPTPKERLEHIRDAIFNIKSFVKGLTVDEFLSDKIRQNAVWVFDLTQKPSNQLTITFLILTDIKNDYKNNKNLSFTLMF